jgi:hypothetical protein
MKFLDFESLIEVNGGATCNGILVTFNDGDIAICLGVMVR